MSTLYALPMAKAMIAVHLPKGQIGRIILSNIGPLLEGKAISHSAARHLLGALWEIDHEEAQTPAAVREALDGIEDGLATIFGGEYPIERRSRPMNTSNQTTRDFVKGQRVQAHPASDAWMRGDRYGEVLRVTRFSVHVRMDISKQTIRFDPSLIMDAEG